MELKQQQYRQNKADVKNMNGINLKAHSNHLHGSFMPSNLSTPFKIPSNTATITTNSSPSLQIIEPTDKDVISGRGHGANRHGGNQAYRNLVKKYKVQYIKAISFLDKQNISMQIIQEIHQGGGRFLKRVYGHGAMTWEVMDMIEIKKKVSQALRENASEVRNILSQECTDISMHNDAVVNRVVSPTSSPNIMSQAQSFPMQYINTSA